MAADRRIALLPVALLLNACAVTATEDTVCHGQRILIHFAPGVDVMHAGL
jgi:hypothetical protein